MESLLQYVAAIGWRWVAVVTGCLLAAADLSNRIWPSWTDAADRYGFTAARRRRAEVAILIAAILWAGYATWRDERAAKEKAQTIATQLQSALSAKGASETVSTISPSSPSERFDRPGPPAARDQPTRGLMRSLANRDLEVLATASPSGFTLDGFQVNVQNVGGDMIDWRLVSLSATVDGVPVLQSPASQEGILAASDSGQLVLKKVQPLTLTQNMKTIDVEYVVEYDTNPKSGVRHFGRKVRFLINWANGPVSLPLFEMRALSQSET